jgi:hypothetical protein
MDLPVRKKLRHTIPQWVAEGSRFFITINCVPPGKNQLCRADRGDAVLTGIKFNHEKFVSHYRLSLLMPDHLDAVMRSRASREWKRSSGTGRSSSLESMAWIGNEIFSITACATITNCKRRPATS